MERISSVGNLIKIIENSRNNALRKVNEELIRMYWEVGNFLSKESINATFGDSYIDLIAQEIQQAFPGIKGFNRRGLYRMKQFYETYSGDEFVLQKRKTSTKGRTNIQPILAFLLSNDFDLRRFFV